MNYIITDPCYIMNTSHYDHICDVHNCNFEGQRFPMWSVKRWDEKPIIIHTIKGTGGDCSLNYQGQNIGIDSGMLCIAECESGWDGESFGALFPTYQEARSAFNVIMREILDA